MFLVELFDSIDLAPLPGEIEAFIPTEFINAGFGDASCLGDNVLRQKSQHLRTLM